MLGMLGESECSTHASGCEVGEADRAHIRLHEHTSKGKLNVPRWMGYCRSSTALSGISAMLLHVKRPPRGLYLAMGSLFLGTFGVPCSRSMC